MARSIASDISLPMVTSRGGILNSSGAMVTPSNMRSCSAAHASPRARTPAIMSSAPSRAELGCCIFRVLDPRNELTDLLWSGAIDVLADDQPRADLGQHILHFELVHAHGLAGLDQVDDVRGQREHRRQLHRTAERDD